MPQTWGPTSSGKLLTLTKDWSFTLNGNDFVLRVGSEKAQGSVLALEGLRAAPGIMWATITFPLDDRREIALDGIPNLPGQSMVATVTAARENVQRQIRVVRLTQNFDKTVKEIRRWAQNARTACLGQLKSKGWLTFEFKRKLDQAKPQFDDVFSEPEVIELLVMQPKAIQDAVAVWQRSFDSVADGINERHFKKEIKEYKHFFDAVEKTPLTDEQARAVVCFDNHILLVC